MARYTKGIITKNYILETAKKIFYEKGYLETTITEICKITNVKLGTFTYYFKTKEALVEEIYAEYLMKHYTYFSNNEQRNTDSLEKNVVATFCYYKIILDNANNTRFHYEVLMNLSIFTFLSKNLRRIYSNFVRDFDLDIDELELTRISSADLGVRRELTLEYIEKEMFESPLDLCITIYTMMGRLFKIKEDIMQSYIKKAIEYIEKHDLSYIKFLV
ncbi:MAG: TetR/AcrR family transcriptional regulator [Eubacteriales bacterium]